MIIGKDRCFYGTDNIKTDLIISFGGNDLIRQQYRDGGRVTGTGCIRTAGFLRCPRICTAVHFIFYFSSAAGPAAGVSVQPFMIYTRLSEQDFQW